MDPLLKDLLTPLPQMGEKCGYDSCPALKDGWINVHLVPHSHGELGLSKTFIDYYSGDSYGGGMRIRANWKIIFDSTISELWAEKERKFTISGSELPYFFHWWARRDGTVHRMVYELIRQGRLVFVGGGWGMPDEASTGYRAVIDSYTYSLRCIYLKPLCLYRAVRRMVYELIRQGRLVFVGGGWGMPDEASTGYRAVIDSYTYSLRKLNATFLSCARPLVAWQADSLGHSREFASLLALMGFDGLFVNPISFDDELIRMERRALEFVWRGSDDLGQETDVYTHKLFDGYWTPPGFCFGSLCSDPLFITSDSLFRNVDERIEQFITQIRYRQSPHYNTRQVMVMMGQRFGYFDAKIWFSNVETLIQKFNERTYKNKEKMHATYSTPACFLKAVYEDNPVLETKQDDFFPYAYKKNTYMTGMYTTRPTFKYLVREADIFLQMAKQLNVLVNLGNYDRMFENFNWIMGVAQDHNVLSGAMRDHVASYYVKKLHSAVQWSTELLQDAFNKIRKSPPNTEYRLCYLNISSCPNTKLDRFHVTIYNPLAWPVTIPVRLPIRNVKYAVFDPSGTKVKAIKMTIPDHVFDIPNRKVPVTHELVFIAENLPPLGLRGYFIQRNIKTRVKRSIIKKLSKNQQKKYYVRQTPKENRTFIEQTREYDDETKPETKIEFGDVDKFDEVNDYDEITPKYKSDIESSIKDMDENLMINIDNGAPVKHFKQFEAAKDNNASIINNYAEFESNTESTGANFGEIQLAAISNGSTFNFSNNNDIQKPVHNNESTSENFDKSETVSVENEPNNITFDGIQKPVNDNEPTNQNDKSEIVNVDNEKDSNFGFEIRTTENIVLLDTKVLRSTTENIGSIEKTTKEYTSVMDPNITKFKTWVPEDADEKFKDTSSYEIDNNDYYARESKDYFIRNQYIQINLDEYRKIASMNLSNGVNTSLDIQYYYYISDDPTDNTTRKPGAYIFRSADTKPEAIIDFIETKVYKSDIVEEIHTKYSKYASFSVKLYINNPLVEIDWVIGPVPVEDNFGKEVFIRYATDLENEGVFYTDANGRQMIKRIRHLRPMYEAYDLDPVAGNFYPVTSRIYIEDPKKNLRFSIFNDRSQGGSSLLEGSIDLMVHRRILTDTAGAFIIINETEHGKGLIVRGNHHLYLTKADHKHNRVYEKKIAKEIEMKPQIMFNRIVQDLSKDAWLNYKNEFTSLNRKLPIGVHILTLQEWNDKTILLRLENYLEKIDTVKSGLKKVDIKNLFVNIKVLNLTEMTLAANMLLKDNVKLNWRVNGSFVRNFNDFYGSNGKIEYSSDRLKSVEDVNLDDGVKLMPQQIRTFVMEYEYIKN